MPFPKWLAGMRITADRLRDRDIQFVDQGEDVVIVNSTTMLDSDISFFAEPGATYWYNLLVSYSAFGEVGGVGSALVGNWDAPSGTAVNRFTQSFPVTPTNLNLNSGSVVVMRRPANTTLQIMGGTDEPSDTADPVVPENFHSAYDQGTILIGGTEGVVTWRFGANRSVDEQTILRGGPNQTRLIYARIG